MKKIKLLWWFNFYDDYITERLGCFRIIFCGFVKKNLGGKTCQSHVKVNVKKVNGWKILINAILSCHRFKWAWFLIFLISANCKIFSFKSSIEIFIIWKCLKFPNVKCFTFLQIRTIQGSLLTFQIESFKKVKVKIREVYLDCTAS